MMYIMEQSSNLQINIGLSIDTTVEEQVLNVK